MMPSKGFVSTILTIFLHLSFSTISLSDTNLPSNKSFSDVKDLNVLDNSALLPVGQTGTENQKNISLVLSESQLSVGQQISQSSIVEDALNIQSLRKSLSDRQAGGIGEEDKPIISDVEEETLKEEKYDMPITINNAVEKSMYYFKNPLSERFNLWLNRSGRYLTTMREIFQEKGLPQDLVFLALIESGFNPYALSWAKAVGPWQFISSTAKRYGLKVNWWVDERRDPIKSTIAAAEYLKDLYDLFGSWNLALAAYNAGEKKILSGLRKTKGGDFWELRNTKYIKRETKEYVPRYMAATIIAKEPEMHGFVVDYYEPLKYDEVIVDSPMDLKVIAKCADTTIEEIKELNPELRRWATPSDNPTYTIKIPAGMKETFLTNLENIPESERFTGRTYRVKNGDTLNKIAKNFGISTNTLREANSLGKNYKARPGDALLIPYNEKSTIVSKTEKKIQIKKDKEQQRKIVYMVKKGDSLYKIAQRHNISPEKIKEWNGLRNNKLRPGDKLYIFTSLDSPAFF